MRRRGGGGGGGGGGGAGAWMRAWAVLAFFVKERNSKGTRDKQRERERMSEEAMVMRRTMIMHIMMYTFLLYVFSYCLLLYGFSSLLLL